MNIAAPSSETLLATRAFAARVGATPNALPDKFRAQVMAEALPI